MDFNIFEYGAYVTTGIVGWFAGITWKRQEQMRKDLSDLEKDLPLHYVRKEDFKDAINDLKDSFRSSIYPILSKLDRMEEKFEQHELRDRAK